MIAAAILAAAVSVAPVQHMQYGGLDRTYRVFRPANLARGRAVPLVVMLHGGFGSGEQAEKAYHWDEAAEKYGFVVLYPDGVGHAWNAGTCCGRPMRQRVDDVGFLAAAIRSVSEREDVDSSRVVVAGMSNGAMMAYKMACDAPVALYGIASVSGTMMTPCGSARPTNVLEIHGTADANVPYNGGKGQGPAGVVAPPVAAVMDRWRTIDGCTAVCPAGRFVKLITLDGAGHQWPGGNPPPPGLAKLAAAFGIHGLDQPSRAIDATGTIVHAMHLASP